MPYLIRPPDDIKTENNIKSWKRHALTDLLQILKLWYAMIDLIARVYQLLIEIHTQPWLFGSVCSSEPPPLNHLAI